MKYTGFFDIDHIRSYLNRSVIRVGDVPIYVTECEIARDRAGRRVTRLLYLMVGDITQKTKRINIKSKRLNLAPVPLGFMNYRWEQEHKCVVLSRVPSRMWKIGLNASNLHIAPVAGNKTTILDAGNLLLDEDFSKTVIGEYPSYKEAVNILDKGELYSTIAFNRHFAVQKRKTYLSLIYYKFNVPVGTCKIKPRLKQIYSFLQEHLDEVMK